MKSFLHVVEYEFGEDDQCRGICKVCGSEELPSTIESGQFDGFVVFPEKGRAKVCLISVALGNRISYEGLVGVYGDCHRFWVAAETPLPPPPLLLAPEDVEAGRIALRVRMRISDLHETAQWQARSRRAEKFPLRAIPMNYDRLQAPLAAKLRKIDAAIEAKRKAKASQVPQAHPLRPGELLVVDNPACDCAMLLVLRDRVGADWDATLFWVGIQPDIRIGAVLRQTYVAGVELPFEEVSVEIADVVG